MLQLQCMILRPQVDKRNIVFSRPTYSIVILLCRKWNVNKSANRLCIYAPKAEDYHLQFLSSLAGVKIKYTHYTVPHPPISFISQQFFYENFLADVFSQQAVADLKLQ
jgi:hypothetical protein